MIQKELKKQILTINLEDYYHADPLSATVPHRYWPRLETRVERNTHVVLDLLDEYNQKATFFVVGWLVDRFPHLIREVLSRGHELSSQGYYNYPIKSMTKLKFRDDIIHARDVIEQCTGQQVFGFRLTRGWLAKDDLWAIKILAENGFRYDSSVRPLGLNFWGNPNSRVIHEIQSRGSSIWELPISSWSVLGLPIPVSGGNFVRQLPDKFMRKRLASLTQKSTTPIIFYFSVWELDVGQPRISNIPYFQNIRQYRNLEEMEDRIRYYLSAYEFCTASNYLSLVPASVQTRPSNVDHQIQSGNIASHRRPITIAVPCYNEEPSLEYLANTLDQFEKKNETMFEVNYLLVDDGSEDRTWQCMQELFGHKKNFKLVRHEKNRGIAAATLTCIGNAETDIVCVIDCDCSYDPQQIVNMVPLLADGVDLVTASPYHKDGKVENVPQWRLFLSQSLSKIYRAVLSCKLDTYTACFRVYRRTAVQNVQIQNDGYLGIIEILARMDMAGAKIVECPAFLESRLFGQSKMKIVKTCIGHLKLLVQLTFEQRKLEKLSLKEVGNE